MALYLLILFILVPLIEISLFIEIGGRIGVGATVAIVILTAVLGTTLLRQQGLAVFRRAQESLGRGEVPVAEVFDGLCLLVAGAVLLAPGFLTDAIGILLFVAPFRRWLGRALIRRVHVGGADHRDKPAHRTIEGEYRHVPPDDEDDDSGDGPS